MEIPRIQKLIDGAPFDRLESYATMTAAWLDALQRTLQQLPFQTPDTRLWLDQIDNVRRQSLSNKTVIGVVGNTGAGKSSVINAVLDEEQLVPTNTMQACTAVATELSYNHDTGPAYRAEVEFVDKTQWTQELELLLSDLVDYKGNLIKDISTVESDGGVAYAKIKAVYPHKTKTDIARSSVAGMMEEVADILGQTITVKADDCHLFYEQLQSYIDSQESAAHKSHHGSKTVSHERQFWPLIKAVRIFCRSEALKTGATIVDLPGTQDENAARAAVAERYMQKCNGLWIVAPIIRAIDDKSAKNLLGQTFRRQMKMDGGLDQVTFICSKTDDISLMEATRSLRLGKVNDQLWTEFEDQVNRQMALEKEIEECKQARDNIGVLLDNIDSQIDEWEQIKDELSADEHSLQISTSGCKRKVPQKHGDRRKKVRFNHEQAIKSDDADDGEGSPNTDQESQEEDTETLISKVLTSGEVSEQLSSCRSQKKQLRAERISLSERVEKMRAEIEYCKEAAKKAKSTIAENCTRGRNDYSREVIRQDFAAGIREMDQEAAQDKNPEDFDPEEDIQDYDKIAASLPVFCVSSRGYQQLRQRRQKDGQVCGFSDVSHTEIPALQEHCKTMTTHNRETSCRKYLVAVMTFASSLSLWIAADTVDEHTSEEDMRQQRRVLEEDTQTLETAMYSHIDQVMIDIDVVTNSNLYDKYESACSQAARAAKQTASKWGVPGDGGYAWSTYKAVCRRNGVYTRAGRSIDFNAQLCKPMMSQLIPGWSRIFSRRVPALLSELAPMIKNLLHDFHIDISHKVNGNGAGMTILPLLEQQISNHVLSFAETAKETNQQITETQREINRKFRSSVATAMSPAYAGCVVLRGPGSYEQMKTTMKNHVESNREQMFKQSCEAVKQELKITFKHAEEQLKTAASSIIEKLKVDYTALQGKTSGQSESCVPDDNDTMRQRLAKHMEVLNTGFADAFEL